MVRVVTLALAIGLAGCVTQEQMQAQQAAIEANEDAQCRSYGAQPGTQPYFDCRMSLHNQRVQVAMHNQSLQAQRSAVMMQTGAALMMGR